jgi:hypothetical protein
MTTTDRAEDGRRSFDAALAGLRERFLAERLPGETAAQWIARTRPGSSLLARVDA